MTTKVREEDILAALRDLDVGRWWDVLDFIGYLRQRRTLAQVPEAGASGGVTLTARDLATSDLVGLWADRTDLPDSVEYARILRRQAEQRGRS